MPLEIVNQIKLLPHLCGADKVTIEAHMSLRLAWNTFSWSVSDPLPCQPLPASNLLSFAQLFLWPTVPEDVARRGNVIDIMQGGNRGSLSWSHVLLYVVLLLWKMWTLKKWALTMKNSRNCVATIPSMELMSQVLVISVQSIEVQCQHRQIQQS